MGDEKSIGSASTSNLTAGSSDSTIEISVKTLESQIYRFRVDRNMSVPSLKEKVASAVGVPVEQQRLIFRGKVLKDDHLLSQYYVEDGHTLHLVVRQPVQSLSQSGTNSGETNRNTENRGNDSNSGAPRSRVGVSRSVVLGSFNVGDQGGEGSGPNLSQIIGAVLNSFGITNQNQVGGANNLSPGMPSNAFSQATHGVETDGTHSNVGGRSEAGNQVPPGQTSVNHTFQSLRQSLPFPLTGAAAVVPSPQMPIPDALHTLSEFMNRMEMALSATGYWPIPSPGNVDDLQREDLPTNGRGLPTPEALSIILRRAQRLLSGHAVAALSHVAGRLEGEGGSTDPAVRNQIQTESVQVGLAILHLGSLLLELGRTTLTLRMGQSAAESVVNAGPAVYISSSGPNPIMVQPFSLQTSSLFGGSSQANSGIIGAVGPVDAPRNVNIHIHAVGSRATNGENTQPEPPNGSRSGPSGSTWAVPMRNIFQPRGRTQQNNQSHTAPAQTSGALPSGTTQPIADDSVPQPPSESVSIPTLVAEISAQIRNLVGIMPGENQVPSEESTPPGMSNEASTCGNVGNEQEETLADNGTEETRDSLNDCNSERKEQQHSESHLLRNEGEIIGSRRSQQASSTSSTGIPSSSTSVGTTRSRKVEDGSEDSSGIASNCSASHDPLGDDKAVPLGLGLGGLQPKRRSKQRSQGVTNRDQPINANQQTIATGQHILQSLVSRGLNANGRDANGPSEQLNSVFGQSMPMEAHDSSSQPDVASMMSQVLNSPALNGLLAGVSEQAGIGSPDGLRNMLEQFTQSPSMRNTLNQIVQQVDGEELSNFSGMERGQGGGVDLSRMVQQMMPLVSQALTGAPTTTEPSYGLARGQGGGMDLSRMVQQMMPIVSQALTGAPSASEHSYNLQSRGQQERDTSVPVRTDEPNRNSQVDLQQVAQRIERNDPPEDIFRTVAEHAASLSNEAGSQDLVEELCRNEDLASEFMEMLHRNMRQQL